MNCIVTPVGASEVQTYMTDGMDIERDYNRSQTKNNSTEELVYDLMTVKKKHRCYGFNKYGFGCGNLVQKGGSYCYLHQWQEGKPEYFKITGYKYMRVQRGLQNHRGSVSRRLPRNWFNLTDLLMGETAYAPYFELK